MEGKEGDPDLGDKILDHQQSVDGREFNRMQNKKWEEKWT
jgi:hypothetical protein